MKAFAYARPTTMEQAASLLSSTKRPKGGGFDLLDLAKRGVSTPEMMIDVSNAPESRAVTMSGDVLAIGASATLAAIARHPIVLAWCPALADAAAEAATPQVRNAATIAGNVLQRPRCAYFRDPFFDCLKRGGTTCPARDGVHDDLAVFGNKKCCAVHGSNLAIALTALRASARLRAAAPKAAYVLRLDEGFFVAPETDPLRETVLTPEDLVLQFTIPSATASAYVEINHKQSFDWAQAACAAVLDVAGGKIVRASVVLGHVAPIPWRAAATEKGLVGKSVTDTDAIELAANSAAIDATPLRDNGHKARLVKVAARRAIQAALARAK